MKLLNSYNENIDLLIEGNQNTDTTVIMVHGFGTDKHENFHYFDDLSTVLQPTYRVIRFDFTGYGKSEGRDEETDYKKQARDLEVVIGFVKNTYPGGVYLLSHSMGIFVTSLLSPDGIGKTVFTGIPNADQEQKVERLRKRILSREGGILNEKGISIYPRSNGQVQKLGPSFWKVLREFDAIKSITEFSQKTKLIMFKPLQDEVVGNTGFENYKSIPTINYVEVNGDHNCTKKEDREALVKKILEFYNS